jgi:hypothetical protein
LTHRQPQEGTVKKGLHRPRLNAIIPILTAAGSHPDCRAVLIQIVALQFGATRGRQAVCPLRNNPGEFEMTQGPATYVVYSERGCGWQIVYRRTNREY